MNSSVEKKSNFLEVFLVIQEFVNTSVQYLRDKLFYWIGRGRCRVQRRHFTATCDSSNQQKRFLKNRILSKYLSNALGGFVVVIQELNPLFYLLAHKCTQVDLHFTTHRYSYIPSKVHSFHLKYLLTTP